MKTTRRLISNISAAFDRLYDATSASFVLHPVNVISDATTTADAIGFFIIPSPNYSFAVVIA